MCKFQSLIKQKFNNSIVLITQAPEEIISLGCAKQCGLITNSKMKKIVDQDLNFKCVSSSIYLKVIYFLFLK
jgi:hypothetical protein